METGSKQFKPSIEYIDQQAVINAHSKSLSLLVGKDFLVLMLYDAEKRKYLGVREYSFNKTHGSFQLEKELSNRFGFDKLLQQERGNGLVLFNHSPYTFIPNAFYKPGVEREVLDFQHKIPFSDRIFQREIPSMDAHLIYAVPDNLVRFMENHFESLRIEHPLFPWISSVVNLWKSETETRVLARITDSAFDLLLWRNKKVERVNSFEYSNAEDYLYYMLFAYEQWGLDPEQTPLYLSGQILKTSPIFEYSWKFIRFVEWYQPRDPKMSTYVMNDLPEHFYPTLTQIHLCE